MFLTKDKLKLQDADGALGWESHSSTHHFQRISSLLSLFLRVY